MRGTIYPRPHKMVEGKKRPLRANESWTDPSTGKTVTAGRRGSAWTWSFTTGSRAEGTRKTHTGGGYRTRKEAAEALAERIAAFHQGGDTALIRPDRTSVGAYLADWLDRRASIPEHERHGLKATTLAGYRDAIRAWIAPTDNDSWRQPPYLGAIPLADLTGDHLAALYAHLRAAGSMCRKCHGAGRRARIGRPGKACPGCNGRGGRPLSARSVHAAHGVLRQALADAVEAGKLQVSPVDRLPRRERPTHTARKLDSRYWEPADARRFLDATADDRLSVCWALMLDTGARRGEVLGLRWDDVDLDAGTVRIHRNRTLVDGQAVETTVKGAAKSRTVDLSGRTAAALRAWRRQTAAERLLAGEAYDSQGHVLVDEVGRPLRPDSLSRWFTAAVKRAGVPPIPLHGLRHTSATVALAAGVPVHVVSDRLGHSSAQVTLGVYSHVLAEQASEAAAAIDRAMFGVTPV